MHKHKLQLNKETIMNKGDMVDMININDLMTIRQLSEKYKIPYGTLYKAIVTKKLIPHIAFGGIRVSESRFTQFLSSSWIGA